MKTFRNQLIKIKNHKLLPEFPEHVLDLTDNELRGKKKSI